MCDWSTSVLTDNHCNNYYHLPKLMAVLVTEWKVDWLIYVLLDKTASNKIAIIIH